MENLRKTIEELEVNNTAMYGFANMETPRTGLLVHIIEHSIYIGEHNHDFVKTVISNFIKRNGFELSFVDTYLNIKIKDEYLILYVGQHFDSIRGAIIYGMQSNRTILDINTGKTYTIPIPVISNNIRNSDAEELINKYTRRIRRHRRLHAILSLLLIR